MNGQDVERDWRDKLERYKPAAADSDWDAMRALLRESPVEPARRSRRWGWWLACVLMLAAAGWTSFSHDRETMGSDFPIAMPGATLTVASAHDPGVRPLDARPRRVPRVVGGAELMTLPLPQVSSPEKEGVVLLPIKTTLSPVQLLPGTALYPLPVNGMSVYLDSLPSIKITPVYRSFYPPPLTPKPHHR